MEEGKVNSYAGVSDEAVRNKTGKSWEEWFVIMDAAGASLMDHKQIVAFLNNEHQVGPWWQQMVTVAYEQARGLREKYQTPQGYQASRSKTIAVPVQELFQAWEEEQTRRRWLTEQGYTIRKATPLKSVRLTWRDGSNVDLAFYAKGDAKSQLTVQQSNLEDAGAVDKAKAFWGKALDKLKELLEA